MRHPNFRACTDKTSDMRVKRISDVLRTTNNFVNSKYFTLRIRNRLTKRGQKHILYVTIKCGAAAPWKRRMYGFLKTTFVFGAVRQPFFYCENTFIRTDIKNDRRTERRYGGERRGARSRARTGKEAVGMQIFRVRRRGAQDTVAAQLRIHRRERTPSGWRSKPWAERRRSPWAAA